MTRAPRHDGLLLWRATALLEAGDAAACVRDCGASLTVRKTSQAFTTRGAARRRLGDHTGALEDCSAALRLDPRNVQAIINRSAARIELGQLEEALHDCNAALRLSPQNVQALVNRAAAQCASGDFAGAERDCNAALRVVPNHEGALANRALAQELADEAKVEAFAQANAQQPQWPRSSRFSFPTDASPSSAQSGYRRDGLPPTPGFGWGES